MIIIKTYAPEAKLMLNFAAVSLEKEFRNYRKISSKLPVNNTSRK